MIARGVTRMPALLALVALLGGNGSRAEEHGDGKPTAGAETVVADLRDEGFRRSQVMEFARVLTDVYGPRYANSPPTTAATDNAAGSAIVMEAMRLLGALDLKPRRTIRAALWGAEESGLLGSRVYVREHFGDPESPEKPAAHANLSVYFNVDWYGRFRGIYLQGNDRARPIFEAWMAPFHDVGMSWIVPGNTCCTDHMAFLETGLQGFQFIQDDLEFFNTTFGRRVVGESVTDYTASIGPNEYGHSRLNLIRACEASLRRLQTDYIDLYQLHRPSPEIPFDEILRALDDLVRTGKIRYIGCSTHPAWMVAEAVMTSELKGYARFVSEQPPYNLLDRRIENELIPMCQRLGLGVITWAPMAMGVLAGRYLSESDYPENSRADFHNTADWLKMTVLPPAGS